MHLSDRALAQLAVDRKLWGAPRAILDYLTPSLSERKFVEVSATVVGRDLNLLPSNVLRGLKRLTDSSVLIREDVPSYQPSAFKLNKRILSGLDSELQLWGAPRAALDYLVPQLSDHAFTEIMIKNIAGALSLTPSGASRTVRRLLETGVLIRQKSGPNYGAGSYKLNSKWPQTAAKER